jgi:hypothetical protein
MKVAIVPDTLLAFLIDATTASLRLDRELIPTPPVRVVSDDVAFDGLVRQNNHRRRIQTEPSFQVRKGKFEKSFWALKTGSQWHLIDVKKIRGAPQPFA